MFIGHITTSTSATRVEDHRFRDIPALPLTKHCAPYAIETRPIFQTFYLAPLIKWSDPTQHILAITGEPKRDCYDLLPLLSHAQLIVVGCGDLPDENWAKPPIFVQFVPSRHRDTKEDIGLQYQ